MKLEGIVTHEMRYKENSKIIKVYTDKLGKISIMAKGANRPKSRIMVNTQLFSCNNYDLFKGRNFYYIQDADLINSNYRLRENLDKMIYASYILELVNKTIEEGLENEKIYELMKKSLSFLAELEGDYLKFILAYELKFISLQGYRPSILNCSNCGRPINASGKFSNKFGGVLSKECFHLDYAARDLSYNEIFFLDKLLLSKLEKLEDIEIDKSSLEKLHYIIFNYIKFTTDRENLNSLNALLNL